MASGPIGLVWTAGSWPDTAWLAGSWADEANVAIVQDLNTRLFVYLHNLYTSDTDLTTMIVRNLATRSGDFNVRWQALVADASA